LFQRQFPRSFRWSELENDPDISKKVRRAIGVSIFEKAPVHQSHVNEHLPWYDSKPWAKHELRRHFQLTDQNNKKLKMSGIAFLDFNLQAVTSENPSLLQQPTDLQEWLDFLAKAHHKQPEDIESLKTTEVKEAYRMAEIDSWDEKLKAEYREQQAKRYNISHYVKGEKKQAMEKGRKRGRKEGRKEGMEEGRKEGKEEGSKETTEKTALMMIDMGLKDEVVLKATFLSPEQLEEIKRNNNK
jgi:mRNA-degrading endonuclease HigB of HigAB toxin-antitoxin module